MPKAFISYSHDNEEHKEKVLAFANRLRREGIDCTIDRYESNPLEGWPNWMRRQVRDADYVLVVCTETYKRRALGEECPGVGLGATWEGILITHDIYNNGGRNHKFIPIILDAADSTHIIDFLSSASRYNVAIDDQYDALYRLLTQQPAVVMPRLGDVKVLPPLAASIIAPEDDSPEVVGRAFFESDNPTIIWRLPRGFIHIESVVWSESYDISPTAYYYNYRGESIQGTHYHPSYDWDRWRGGIDPIIIQCRKLGVPVGDHSYSSRPIRLMMQIGMKQVRITREGEISDSSALDDSVAALLPPGTLLLPKIPPKFRPRAASGCLRDLIVEVNEERMALAAGKSVSDSGVVRRIRREVRLEAHRILSDHHPAIQNLDEIIENYKKIALIESVQWLDELSEALSEAVHCVEEQTT